MDGNKVNYYLKVQVYIDISSCPPPHKLHIHAPTSPKCHTVDTHMLAVLMSNHAFWVSVLGLHGQISK